MGNRANFFAKRLEKAEIERIAQKSTQRRCDYRNGNFQAGQEHNGNLGNSERLLGKRMSSMDYKRKL